MTFVHLTCADTAKALRAALRAEFPGCKFRVTSQTYAGGASIRVTWTDGPSRSRVVALADRFAGADFNAIEDIKEYRRNEVTTTDGRTGHPGADYVFCDRDISDELRARINATLPTWVDGTPEHVVQRHFSEAAHVFDA